jgi:hypothetical protein
MSRLPATPGGPDAAADVRLELAAAAAAAERRNRPLVLVLGAAALLGAATVYALAGANSLRESRRAIDAAREADAEIAALAAQLRALAQQGRTEVHDPDPTVPSNLERLAAAVGLPARPKLDIKGGDGTSPGPGLRKKQYTVSIKEAPSQSLVNWLVRATGPNDAGLTGLEVAAIKVTPNKAQGVGVAWDAEVTLTRIERGG